MNPRPTDPRIAGRDVDSPSSRPVPVVYGPYGCARINRSVPGVTILQHLQIVLAPEQLAVRAVGKRRKWKREGRAA